MSRCAGRAQRRGRAGWGSGQSWHAILRGGSLPEQRPGERAPGRRRVRTPLGSRHHLPSSRTPMTAFDVDALRDRFPALSLEQDGRPVIFFDGPGGTQVPQQVIDAVTRYYRESNANTDGAFLTSRRSDAIIAEAHQAMADMLGAASPDEIKFGPNMTTLTFHISRSIVATMAPGDEIVLTGLDHDGNVDPWLGAARARGLTVRCWEPRLEDCTLDLAGLDALLSPKTRLVAVGWGSHAVRGAKPAGA